MPRGKRRDRESMRFFSDTRGRRLKVERQLRRLSQKRGSGAETLVDQALAQLKNEGEIRHFYYDRRLEHQGIDRMIVTDWREVPLQVKSSVAGIRQHFEHHPPEKGERISVVMVGPGEKVASLKTKIRKILDRRVPERRP